MADADQKISVHSLADLKNTSDDAIPNYLNSLKFTQSHILTDVRLTLGYSAFAICAACFYWDYKLGFEGTKYYTAVAVLLYAILNTALTVWIWGVEKGTVYVGTSPTGEKIEISTATKKHVPVYNVTVKIYPKGSSKAASTIEIKQPFKLWFDAEGHFVPLPFQQMLAINVPAIAKSNTKRSAAVEEKASLDSAEVSSGASASGSSATPGRAAKSRKKA